MPNEVVNEGGLLIEPLLTRPEHVAIVALGHSSNAFMAELMSDPGLKNPFDEVWTVNRGLRSFPHDKVFVMDDLKWIEKHKPDYAKFLKNHDKPIITSTRYDDYPMSVEYPLHHVMQTIEDDVFTVNTVAYMLAYAIHIRAKQVSIYGADFMYPNGDKSESGGQAVAYLCGVMRYFGMVHRIPGNSSLLYANKVQMTGPGTQGREPYGYHRRREMEEADKKAADLVAARQAVKTVGD